MNIPVSLPTPTLLKIGQTLRKHYEADANDPLPPALAALLQQIKDRLG